MSDIDTSPEAVERLAMANGGYLTSQTLRALSTNLAERDAEIDALRALVLRKDAALALFLEAIRFAGSDSWDFGSDTRTKFDNAVFPAREALALTPEDMAGWVAVPREPTEAMVEAWENVQPDEADFAWGRNCTPPKGWDSSWHFEAAYARATWRAMLKASR